MHKRVSIASDEQNEHFHPALNLTDYRISEFNLFFNTAFAVFALFY